MPESFRKPEFIRQQPDSPVLSEPALRLRQQEDWRSDSLPSGTPNPEEDRAQRLDTTGAEALSSILLARKSSRIACASQRLDRAQEHFLTLDRYGHLMDDSPSRREGSRFDYYERHGEKQNDREETSPDEAQDSKEKRETTLPPNIISEWVPRTIRLGQSKPENEKPSSAGHKGAQ